MRPAPEERLENAVTPTNEPSFYKELLEHISDGVYFLDRDRRIQYWSEGAFRLTGYTAEELLGQYCPDYRICHVDSPIGQRLCEEKCPLTTSVDTNGPHEVRWFLQHKQGGRVPVVLRAEPLRSADGSIVGTVAIFRDDSVQHEARRKLEEMERLAFLDQVTQLPNRRYVEMRLRTALDEFHVHHDPFGVLVVDLDRFKAINDDFGHATGDRALREVGKALLGTLRSIDIVGRWGGDEFTAIVPHVDNETLRVLAERCCITVAQTLIPISDDTPVAMSVSIGGSRAVPNDTVERLLKRADGLMYQCKASGRGCASTDKSSPVGETKMRRAATTR